MDSLQDISTVRYEHPKINKSLAEKNRGEKMSRVSPELFLLE